MYIPAANRITDPATINGFIHSHGFATLVSVGKAGPWASHLPFVFDEEEGGGRLRCHMARANEQWQHFASNPEVLCVFHGPHAYISPSWYAAKVAVPTWNYAAVHVYGTAKLEDDAFLLKTIEDTTTKYESKMPVPWKMDLPKDFIARMMTAIVGFSIRITKIEAKYKLGQGRSEEDQLGTLAGLDRTGAPESISLASFIREHRASSS